jgi:hypothetical protein
VTDDRELAIERLCSQDGMDPGKAANLLETLERAGLTVGLSDAGGGRVTPPALGNPFRPEPKTSPDVPDALLVQCKGSTGIVAAGLKLLASRVDALYLAFQIDFDRSLVWTLFDPAEQGKRDWSSPSGLTFQIRNTRAPGVVLFDNADMRARFDADDQTGFGLEVILRATFLATHTIPDCLALMQRFASDLGTVKGVRVRRIDLAADFAGWSLLGIETEAWVVQRRAGLVDYAEVPIEVHHQCCRLTGFTVGKSALRMRVYDKRQELRFRADKEKTRIEEESWRAAGWTDDQCVTRIEFQLRGVAMDQLDLRDCEQLASRLDPVWQYLVNDWVRLAVPDTASRRTNWELDPRWQVVRLVTFVHKAAPAERLRRRGGARMAHTSGCVLSAIVSRHDIGPPVEPAPISELPKMVGHGPSPRAYADWCARAIRLNEANLAAAYKTESSDDFIERFGPIDGWERYKKRWNTARARFWSLSDDPLKK